MRIQRFTEHTAMPWANGRGTSYEVARSSEADWVWRVAIAPVIEPGPFSILPGVDRWLAVTDEASLELVVDGLARRLGRGDVIAFAGESIVTAQLPVGPTRDYGLMVRRGMASGSLSVSGSGRCRGGIFVAIGDSVIGLSTESIRLGDGDALIVDESIDVVIESGLVCVVEVGP